MEDAPDGVDYISGRTRIFAIVGHPIEQVRSPELVTAEFRRRGADAIMVPLHVLPDAFEGTMRALMAMPNLGGLVLTIPFKARGCALADRLSADAQAVGAINVLVRDPDGRWRGEILDGLGCVAAFRRRGLSFAGRRVCLIGAGGAGAAIAVAVAAQGPRAIRLFDLDGGRADALAARVRAVAPSVSVTVAPPAAAEADILMNASPVGMLGDARLPFAVESLPAGLVVFDAVVKPARTPLLALAARCGCTVVTGREMMQGQIGRMVDVFGWPAGPGAGAAAS